MTIFFDAFISYGRADSKAFAQKLQARLDEQGFKVWFDFNDIPLAVDFQNQIDDGIEKASHFLFIIAPHSVNSPYCRKEIELAIKLNKRIIPLLHVMEISQETWQQRNPKGTPPDWESYQAKGLHESYKNMHPTIRKLNWVYFQENQDDFEKSLANLVTLLHSHPDYVEKHTRFLVKALEWERHQKQTNYLLTGEEKKQAETWLKIRFKDEQPPCTPTDLHGEYITESIKNANNLMTQVFLSYADENKATMEKIRNSLRRESITVWTNTTDIQTGEAFDAAIKRGIEQADNLVFLISPESVNSTYCQQELGLALSLHKRIIPVLVRETDPNQVEGVLRELQYIDLTDNVKEDDYLLDESQLLKTLHQDAAYYNEHKILLAKALKWQQQQNNPSILLRGYNLHSAQAWLKVAQKRTQHLPTTLQEEFIAASLQQPPLESLDVFISYSRADADFARMLNDALQMQGKTTWFDQESIASGSDFQQEIYRGIRVCDNILFILSPHSVNSPYCASEVEYAASLNKRFVTVLYQPVNTAELHPELAKVQWIDFNQNQQDFNANFNQLVRTLDTDREHVQNHSKWLQRALEWQQKDKGADLLLRGSEFAVAENWLQEAERDKKKPIPTPLQQEYIRHSREAIEAGIKLEKRRVVILRSLLGLMSAAFVVTLGVGWLALMAKEKAEKNLLAQVNALSRYSKFLSDSHQEFDALIEGIRASKALQEQSNDPFARLMSVGSLDRKQSRGEIEREVKEVLQRAIFGVKELNRIEAQKFFQVSPDNQTIVTLTKEGKVRLWDFQGNSQIAPRDDQKNITDEKIPDIYSIDFSGDGKEIVTVNGAEDKRTIKRWDNQGQLIQSFDPIDKFDSMFFIPNGKLIATVNLDEKSTVKLWKIEGKKLTSLLPNETLSDFSFSDDGNQIATVSGEGDKRTIKLWDNQGQLIQSFAPIDKFDYMFLSPKGKLIVTTNRDNSIYKVWKMDGKQLKLLLPNETLSDISFSDDGNRIATVSGEGDKRTIKLWDNQGQLIQSLDPIDKFDYMYFSPNLKLIVSSSLQERNRTYKLWKIDEKQLKPLLPNETFSDFSFSQDGNRIATLSNNIIRLWTEEGEELQTLNLGTGVKSVYFSSDGQNIATVSSDETVRFWEIESRDRKLLKGNNAEFNTVKLSPTDSQWFATTYSTEGENQTAQLWLIEGKELKPLLSNEQFNDVEFSPDGKRIAIISKNGDKTTIKLWKKDTNPIGFLTFANEQFGWLEFSPDGKLIATYQGKDDNQTAQLWSLGDQEPQPLLSNEQFNGVSFSNNGKLIATSSGEESNKTVKLWSLQGKNPQPLLSNEQFNHVSFSEDGKLIATYRGKDNNKTAKLWSLEGKELQPLLFKETFNRIEFSDNGKLIVTFSKSSDNQKSNRESLDNQEGNRESSDNQTVKLWPRDGKEIATFPRDEKIDSVTFSPDGELIATFNNDDSTVKVWTLAGYELKPLQEAAIKLDSDSYHVLPVEFSPDSQLIATVNHNKVIQLWNREGKELANFDLNDSIQQMSFSPDSQILAISPNNKAPILWYLKRDEWERQSKAELDSLMKQACKKVVNYLHNKPKEESDRTLCD